LAHSTDEVAAQILSKRHHLSLEAPAQLAHQLLIGHRRFAIDHITPERSQQPATRALRCQRREHTLDTPRDRAPPDRQCLHQSVDGRGSRSHRGVGLDLLHSRRILDPEEAQHRTHRSLVIGTEIVVDQHQHLLGREYRAISPQLLDISHMLGVQKRQWPQPPTREILSRPPVLLESKRRAQVILGLDPRLYELQVNGAQEAGGLAQDRDDARRRLNLRDQRRGRVGPEIGRRRLAQDLICARTIE